MYRMLIAGVFAVALFTNALAVDVLLVRTSSIYDNTSAIAAVLTAGGHNVTIVDDLGNGITIPNNTQVIFLQGYLHFATATQVANWLSQQSGRGLVTTEWVVWYDGGFSSLANVLPVTTNRNYSYPSSVTYTQVTADPLMNANLPASFSFSSGVGGVTRFAAKQGATVFYAENYFNGVGVAGWELSSGARVVSINAVAQDNDSLNSPEFRQLLVNAVTWAAAGREPCRLEGDVNGDNVVNNADLLIVLFNFGRSCP
ncbi:MAG: hypothetical protein RMJ83_04655 [Armatimonadota bacterium]|nr:hypothetical protein [Armatimonadota bacterium]